MRKREWGAGISNLAFMLFVFPLVAWVIVLASGLTDWRRDDLSELLAFTIVCWAGGLAFVLYHGSWRWRPDTKVWRSPKLGEHSQAPRRAFEHSAQLRLRRTFDDVGVGSLSRPRLRTSFSVFPPTIDRPDEAGRS